MDPYQMEEKPSRKLAYRLLSNDLTAVKGKRDPRAEDTILYLVGQGV